MMIATAITDPGTVPSRAFLKQTQGRNIDSIQSEHKNWMINLRGYMVKLKYCDTCELVRPPRSIHCDDCGACILVLDHHCPWVGSCVGKRNYRFFLLFVNSTGLLLAFYIGCIFANMQTMSVENDEESEEIGSLKEGYKESLRTSPVNLILLVLCIVFSVFVFLLCFYHHFLLCIRQTTNEHLKHTFRRGMNPFKKTYCGYFSKICYRKKPKRLWKPKLKPRVLE
mmetsp:Transcript_11804/g.8602  ORF Transcript_11804/g.8602 Transcript_11804/m.8602 type:complete len:225 (+) Transcript_11804:286-960(+)